MGIDVSRIKVCADLGDFAVEVEAHHVHELVLPLFPYRQRHIKPCSCVFDSLNLPDLDFAVLLPS